MRGYEPWSLLIKTPQPRRLKRSKAPQTYPIAQKMAGEDQQPNCPILEGPSNFQIWSIHIKGALSEKQVLGVVTGTDTKQPTQATSTSISAAGRSSKKPEESYQHRHHG